MISRKSVPDLHTDSHGKPTPKRPGSMSRLHFKRPVILLDSPSPASPTTDLSLLPFQIGNEEVSVRVDRLLGNGGYGKCYAATVLTGPLKQTIGGNQLAIKIVDSRVVAQHANIINQEITIHSKLEHKNIARLYGHFYDSLANRCLLLELCMQRSVVDLVEARGYLSGPLAVRLLRGLVKGTTYLHTQWRIVHRDIKPSNLLLTSSLRLKMSDFGLACPPEQCWEERERVCGTPNYLAPEIFLKQGHSFQSDIWAIGISLFFIYAGRPPFACPPTLPGHCPDSVVRTIYRSVLAGQYEFSANMDLLVRKLVTQILRRDPTKRASLEEIMASDLCLGYCPCRKPFCTCSVRSLGQTFAQLVSKHSSTANSQASSTATTPAAPLPRRTTSFSGIHDQVLSPGSSLIAQISADPVRDLVDLLGSRAKLPPGQQAAVWITRWSLTSAGVLYYTLSDGTAGAADRHSQGLLLAVDGRMTEIKRGCCPSSLCSLESLRSQCDFIRSHLQPYLPATDQLARLNALCFASPNSQLPSPAPPIWLESPLDPPVASTGPVFLRRWTSANTSLTSPGESLLFLFSNGFWQANLPNHTKLLVYRQSVLYSVVSGHEVTTTGLTQIDDWLSKYQEHYQTLKTLLFNIL